MKKLLLSSQRELGRSTSGWLHGLTSKARLNGERLKLWGRRFSWAILLLCSLTVLIIAAWLTPSPLGEGTHTQLGLPPCYFSEVTSIPCPGCGLTTSFSNMMHLNWVQAVQSNVFGVVLFLLTLMCVPVSAIGAVKGLPLWETLFALDIDKVLIFVSLVGLLNWVVRIVQS